MVLEQALEHRRRKVLRSITLKHFITMARVYVGTYHKYNEGNLYGKWVDLSDFSTYADFLAYCRAIHSNERDPEFMIQDCEHFPDGLSVTEWLTEEDFNDVKNALASEIEEQVRMETGTPSYEIVDYSEKAIAVTGDTRPIADTLKALGGRFNPRLSCGAGWIFSKRKEEELRNALAGGEVKTTDKAVRKTDDAEKFTQEYVRYVEQMDETPYWKDYYLKHKDYAVRLQDGWHIISKPRIENKFCFHDEGPDYEFYKTLMADENKLRNYFLSENLDKFDKEIDYLKGNETLYLRPVGKDQFDICPASVIFGFYSYRVGNEEPRQVSADERKALLEAYGVARAEFEKRLQTYLKRYGVSKLHTWTYWADA